MTDDDDRLKELADQVDQSWTDFITSDGMVNPLPSAQLRALITQTAVTVKMLAAAIDRLKSDLRAEGIEFGS